MKKKIVSVLVFLCMLAVIISPATGAFAADSVWNGGTAVPSLVNGYYQIASAENLAWFAGQINSGSTTIKAQVTSDIYLNETGSTEHEWVPIGSESMPFKGEFDGGGHTIYGLYVTGNNDYSGLFGYVYTQLPNIDSSDDSTTEITVPEASKQIYNLHVKDASVSGGQNVGGIVGYIHFGIISGCSFEGTVTSSLNSVGGIVGYAYEFSQVNQCYSKGSVTGAIRTAMSMPTRLSASVTPNQPSQVTRPSTEAPAALSARFRRVKLQTATSSVWSQDPKESAAL